MFYSIFIDLNQKGMNDLSSMPFYICQIRNYLIGVSSKVATRKS